MVDSALEAPPSRWRDRRGRDWQIVVTWGYLDDDRLAPVGFEVRSYQVAEKVDADGWLRIEHTGLHEVTRELVKELPLGAELARSRSTALSRVRARAVQRIEVDKHEHEHVVIDERALEFIDAEKRARLARRRGGKLKDLRIEERLPLVADLYRTGLQESPGAPSLYVYEELKRLNPTEFPSDASGRAQVRKWVARARRAGLIAAPSLTTTSANPATTVATRSKGRATKMREDGQ